MEYRKLIKFGNSSFVISLPKNWITKHNIKKGDVIYFEENEAGDMVLSSHESNYRDDKKIINLNIDGMTEKQIELEIISGYMKDFSRIIFTGKEIASRQSEIRTILHRLVAIEVIEQTKDKIVAKDFLNMKEIQIKDLRRRLDTVVKSMIADSKIGEGKENYESVYNRDYDVNKFAYVMLRVIRRGIEKPSVRKSLGISVLDLVYEQLAVLSMERVADRAKRISRIDARSKLTKAEITELNKIYSIISENYDQAVKGYKDKDYKLSCSSFSNNKKIQTMCDKTREKIKSVNGCKIIGLLREMSQRVSELGEVGFMGADSTVSKGSLEKPLRQEQQAL